MQENRLFLSLKLFSIWAKKSLKWESWIRIRIKIKIVDPDPHWGLCGSETLVQRLPGILIQIWADIHPHSFSQILSLGYYLNKHIWGNITKFFFFIQQEEPCVSQKPAVHGATKDLSSSSSDELVLQKKIIFDQETSVVDSELKWCKPYGRIWI